MRRLTIPQLSGKMAKKVILCGSHWAGCMALRLLYDRGYEVFVYTHETAYNVPSLREYCESLGVSFTISKISLSNLPFQPDLICSIYYRDILQEDLTTKFSGSILNLHPSLLPKFSGCSSLTWAMIHGENEVGYTYHYIERSVDTGNIIVQKSVKLEAFDTQETLYIRTMEIALRDFYTAIDLVFSGYSGIPQSGERTYFKRGCPLKGQIDPEWDDTTVKRFIRAMTYPPYDPAYFNGNKVYTFEQYQELREKIEN